MSEQLASTPRTIGDALGDLSQNIGRGVARVAEAAYRRRRSVMAIGLIGLGAYAVYAHPPFETLAAGELAVRSNRLDGGSALFRDGVVLVIPGVHTLRRFDLRDQVYRPAAARGAAGPASFQSVEGLTIGIDISLRYALDPQALARVANRLPVDLSHDVVEPAAQSIFYKNFARYSVREIFSSKRQEIQQAIETELKARLAADGVTLKRVHIGKVELPADYKAGIEQLLAEELASEKMRFTLELKEKLVRQTGLEAEADKLRREKAAEAAGNEQLIAAKSQAEAMKHVLPFKEKQIAQRGLEADADKLMRIKQAEAAAEARRIEAAAEADSRRKLAEADAFRQERLGKVASEQLARDGAVIAKHPLLIQKTLADKLSDKISVIIAPPPTDGGFIGSTLLGGSRTASVSGAEQVSAGEN